MTNTSTITDLRVGLTAEELTLAGAIGQVLLEKVTTKTLRLEDGSEDTKVIKICEFYDTVELATAAKTDWDT
tara:strand:+ start:2425 stop:2640 length:216 start_codon:yes stop_codon:yes gene_type:complete